MPLAPLGRRAAASLEASCMMRFILERPCTAVHDSRVSNPKIMIASRKRYQESKSGRRYARRREKREGSMMRFFPEATQNLAHQMPILKQASANATRSETARRRTASSRASIANEPLRETALPFLPELCRMGGKESSLVSLRTCALRPRCLLQFLLCFWFFQKIFFCHDWPPQFFFQFLSCSPCYGSANLCVDMKLRHSL